MSEDAPQGVSRARRALETARSLIATDPEATASRAYYAAFHAVSEIFRREGHTYARHSAVQAAVHRDLVRKGYCSVELGKDYTYLLETRTTGDYDNTVWLTSKDAAETVAAAERIVLAAEKLLAERDSERRGEGA
ncbi:MAG: HEPN domain-containing protein [Candidatus Methylomirabilia bacterium]